MCENFKKYCAKYLLIVINILFFVLGIGVTVVGTWIIAGKTSLINLVTNATIQADVSAEENMKNGVEYYFTFAALIVIGTGALIILLSLVGCFGAIKESKCLLILYASVVILITLAQSIGIILSAVFQQKLKTQIGKLFKSSLTHYGTEPHITSIWNTKMNKLECCGVTDYSDFETLNSTILIPAFCCSKSTSTCNVDSLGKYDAEDPRGCLEKGLEVITGNMHYAIIVAAAVIVIEILGIAFALGLSNNIDSDNDDDSESQMELRGATYGGGGRIDSVWPSTS